MNQTSTRRLVASTLLAALATTLAACGISGGPVLSPSTGLTGSSIYAARSGEADRRFGLTFDGQTPKVKVLAGGVRGALAASADLRSRLSPIDDQGRIGACTGFAMTGLAEYRARQSGNKAELSPGFVYLMELKEDGNLGQDAGSRISTGMKVLQKYGISTEALHPYLAPAAQTTPANITAYLTKVPTAEAIKNAAANKIPGMKAINDLDGFKASLASGKPVVFGIAVYKSFMSPAAKTTGIIPMPDTNNEQMLGGHAIMAVGYDDAKQQVIFRNSWNTTWGDKGYGYLPYDYFKHDLAGDAWSTL